jgi:hypothetical protein
VALLGETGRSRDRTNIRHFADEMGLLERDSSAPGAPESLRLAGCRRRGGRAGSASVRVAVIATAVLAGAAGVPGAVGFGVHAPVRLGKQPCNLGGPAGMPPLRARRCIAVTALGGSPSQGSGKGLPARKPIGGEWLSKAMGQKAKDSDYVSKTGTLDIGRFACFHALVPLCPFPFPFPLP